MDNVSKVKEHLYAAIAIIVIVCILAAFQTSVAGMSADTGLLALIIGSTVGVLFASPLAIITYFVCNRNNEIAKYILIGVFILFVLLNLYLAFYLFTLHLGALLIVGMLFGAVIWLY